MKLKQIRKPTPKCLNCKTYLDWCTNKWKEEDKPQYKENALYGEGDFGIYVCGKCNALYKGNRAERI